MEDISLHVLDIVENSIDAGAKKIVIEINEDLKNDLLTVEITDDGRGMDAETKKKVLDPFFTTKSVRKVGLGLSLFREAARVANGDLTIHSRLGQGTKVKATFKHSHIDRKPLGDMVKTMTTLIIGHPEIWFKYLHRKNGTQLRLDTSELRTCGDPLSKGAVEIMNWVKENLHGVQ